MINLDKHPLLTRGFSRLAEEITMILIKNLELLDHGFKADYPDLFCFIKAVKIELSLMDRADIVDSLEYYQQWLKYPSCDFICDIEAIGHQNKLAIILRRHQKIESSLAKAMYLLELSSKVASNTPYPLFGAVFSAVKVFFNEGLFDQAYDILSTHMKHWKHMIFDEAWQVIEFTKKGKDIPPYLQGVFGKSDYFKNFFCTMPFQQLNIDTAGNAFICCPSYLPLASGNLRTSNSEDVINSELSQKIRRSILNGSYSYCNKTVCSLIVGEKLWPKEKNNFSSEMLRAIEEQIATVDQVENFSLGLDRVCNLSCPSCRNKKIIESKEELIWKKSLTKNKILPMLKSIKTLVISGNGELAISPVCRIIFENVTPQEYPHLKFGLVTNGLLFSEAFWNKYQNIHSMIKYIRVSVDGATQQSYEKLRRGGRFSTICKNLQFISSLKKQGIISDFSMFFVYQLDNFREMKKMALWAAELGCNTITFEKMFDTHSYSREEYLHKAVHLPNNPYRNELLEITRDPVFYMQHVVRDWV